MSDTALAEMNRRLNRRTYTGTHEALATKQVITCFRHLFAYVFGAINVAKHEPLN